MGFVPDSIGRLLRVGGANKGEREAQQENLQPTYGNELSVKSVLIAVVVFVAIVIGFFVLFT